MSQFTGITGLNGPRLRLPPPENFFMTVVFCRFGTNVVEDFAKSNISAWGGAAGPEAWMAPSTILDKISLKIQHVSQGGHSGLRLQAPPFCVEFWGWVAEAWGPFRPWTLGREEALLPGLRDGVERPWNANSDSIFAMSPLIYPSSTQDA